MKKYIYIGILAIAMFSVSGFHTSIVEAQEEDPRSLPPEIRERLETRQENRSNRVERRVETRQDRVETRKENRQDRVETRQENRATQIEDRRENRQDIRENRATSTLRLKISVDRTEKANERFTSSVTQAQRALTTVTTNLISIANRIEMRLETITETGSSTQEAQALVDDAQANFASIEEKIGALSNLSFSTENPKESLDALKEAVTAIRKDIQETHKKLMDSVRVIKN